MSNDHSKEINKLNKELSVSTTTIKLSIQLLMLFHYTYLHHTHRQTANNYVHNLEDQTDANVQRHQQDIRELRLQHRQTIIRQNMYIDKIQKEGVDMLNMMYDLSTETEGHCRDVREAKKIRTTLSTQFTSSMKRIAAYQERYRKLNDELVEHQMQAREYRERIDEYEVVMDEMKQSHEDVILQMTPEQFQKKWTKNVGKCIVT